MAPAMPIFRWMKWKTIVRKNNADDGHNYLIYVGSVHPRKNVKNLLLYDRLRTETTTENKLMIAGHGMENGWNAGIFDNMTFKDDVIFTGHLQCTNSPE